MASRICCFLKVLFILGYLHRPAWEWNLAAQPLRGFAVDAQGLYQMLLDGLIVMHCSLPPVIRFRGLAAQPLRDLAVGGHGLNHALLNGLVVLHIILPP